MNMTSHALFTRVGIGGVCSLVLVLMAGPSLAHDVYLVAKAGEVMMPDGNSIPIWGYAEDPDGFDTGDPEGTATLPGPVIDQPLGDTTLNIHLRNALPQLSGADVPTSVVILGQGLPKDGAVTMAPVFHTAPSKFDGRVRSFTGETDPGDTRIYTFTGLRHGSYIYQSGTHSALQVQMGLHGGLTVNAGTDLAYEAAADGADVSYDQQVVLVYSEIDPAVHADVSSNNYDSEADPETSPKRTSMIDYDQKYSLINGQPFPATTPFADLSGNVLVRILNAGMESHTPVLQAGFMDILAEDGNLYPYARTQYSVRVPAGSTRDAMIAVTCAGPPAAERHALYDGSMQLTNGATSPGGMRINLHFCGVPADADADGLPDDQDNCTDVVNPDQRDTNGDGFGNICDADLSNDGLLVNFGDLAIMKSFFFGADPDADLNGDGVVNFGDLAIMKSQFFGPPGASALAP